MTNSQKRARCAIYTRKSSEEGLEQEFNSLHAQREACEAFILSQRHEGWSIVSKPYDDGGWSGGSMERPALQALLADIAAGQIDVIVVYKIDRLTRSLFDFAKIVEVFDAHQVSFVSVTQSFNTTTSMGRLTLNVLLSFAQFEREVTGERIRDKIAASRKKGMWMGGNIPLGYDLTDHKLVVNEEEAKTVNTIFDLYLRLGTVVLLKAELQRRGLKTKKRISESGRTSGGGDFHVGHLYWLLKNPVYIGSVRHKDKVFAGEQEAIVEIATWNRVQEQLASNAHADRCKSNAKDPSLLAGLLYDEHGNKLGSTHARKGSAKYRYYLAAKRNGEDQLRLPAADIEDVCRRGVEALLKDGSQLVDELKLGDRDPHLLQMALAKAAAFSGSFADGGPTESRALFVEIVQRVTVSPDQVTVIIDKASLARILDVSFPTDDQVPITVQIPIALRRLGKAKKLVVTAGPASRTRFDEPLIRAVVRAHAWFEMLKAGEAQSIADLARRSSLHRTYVSSLLPLAFLAPDITEAIVEGRQPATVTLDRLINGPALPADWVAQRELLGIR